MTSIKTPRNNGVENRLTGLEINQDILKTDMKKVKSDIENLRERTQGVITFKTLLIISMSIPAVITGLQFLIKFLLQKGV